MASATKDLSLLGSTLELNIAGIGAERGNLHYKAGTGTILLEATNDVRDSATWFTMLDAAGTAITGKTTVGVTAFPINGYSRIRARNTLAGVGNEVSLAVD